MSTTLTIAGVGCRSGSDDAIGLHLVEQLDLDFFSATIEPVSWEDADALTITHELLEFDRPVLIVDCADMRLDAGEWRFFGYDQIRRESPRASVSTHGLGIQESLSLARELGYGWPVWFFGVQPFDLSPGFEMTPEMQAAYDGLSSALRESIGNAITELELTCLRTG